MPEASRKSASGLREETSDEGAAEELPALPPIADLVSREIRRMGRAWKIEATKSVLHIVFTMLVVSVLGAGWFILLVVVASLGWYGWWRFKLKATVKPCGFLTRSPAVSEANSEEAEYADWLVGSATEAE